MTSLETTQKHQESLAPNKFTILSLNLFIRPPGIISHPEGDYKDERIKYFKQHFMSDYDLICFQEFFAFGSNRRSKFIQSVSTEFPHTFALNNGQCYKLLIDGGLLMVSREKLINQQFETLLRGVYSDW